MLKIRLQPWCVTLASTTAILLLGSAMPTSVAGELPVPCIAGSCGLTAPGFVGAGSVNAVSTGNSLTINQLTDSAILNWRSFNISADGRVTFVQPSASALAVNRIFSADPSRIFGSLSANGRIYLINQNGILFGDGARVDVGGLIASSLDITPSALENGITGAGNFGAFRRGTDGSGALLPAGSIQVASGADLFSAGGQIFLFAPTVENFGSIRTPDGQSILAAGDTVFLSATNDVNLRGLLVEVATGGTVTNGAANPANTASLVGQIIAERGNITLAGLAVNQNGRLSATTSVRANGSIRLIAGDDRGGGDLLLGRNSRTEIGLDATDPSTTVDVNTQPRSTVELEGRRVTLAAGAQIVAPSGRVDITARANRGVEPTESVSDGSRLLIESGATIDVSGANAVLPIERNVARVELRGSQVADSPIQRDSALRGQTVFVDIRRSGTLPDGTAWQGTPLANVTGDISNIVRDVVERNLNGGGVTLRSQGDVIVASGAVIDTSGGSVRYLDGFINTTTLIGADGRLYDIGSASADRVYTGIAGANTVTLTDPRWGVTRTYTGLYGNSAGRFESGYIEGRDAGSLLISAPNVIFDGSYRARVQVGPYQRLAPGVVSLSSLYRPFDQLPLSGLLQLGQSPSAIASTDNNFIEPGIVFSSLPVLGNLRNASGTLFDPQRDPMPLSLSSVFLNPTLIGQNAAGRVVLRANGLVNIPQGVSLQLPAAGSLDVFAGRIDLAGSVSGIGSQVSLQTAPTQTTLAGSGGILVGSQARLNLAGAWVNENPLFAMANNSVPLILNGGSFRAQVRDGALRLTGGSIIDVSGGARQRADGTFAFGRGGQINLSASSVVSTAAAPFSLEAELRAFGFANGGNLALGANRVCIVAVTGQCAGEGEVGTLTLRPDFFGRGGFANYSLAANQRGLLLAEGTEVLLRQRNWLLDSTLVATPSSAALPVGLATGVLSDLDRAPVNLSLSSRVQTLPGQSFDAADIARLPILELGRNSLLAADPGATVSLAGDNRIAIDGRIDAPGGRIAATLQTGSVASDLNASEYAPTMAIWLGDNARLDASGVARIRTDDLGLRSGTVLDGGSVSLAAQRGAVISNPGSVIDVSGSRAELDIRQVADNGTVSYERQAIASAGGSVAVSAAEAALLSGTLRADSGDPGRVSGGQFSLTLDANNRYGTFNFFAQPPYSFAPRRIDIASDFAPIAISSGAPLPSAFLGRALVSAGDLAQAGFASIGLEARSLEPQLGTTTVGGEIRFIGDARLTAGRSIVLDASLISSDGGQASAAAPYLLLGQSYRRTQSLPLNPVAGSGQLSFDARLLELVGQFAFSGAGVTQLRSAGDLRLRGIQGLQQDVQTIAGSASTPGNLLLQAGQIYPTTLTRYAVSAGGRIDIAAAPGETDAPTLSAGGNLTLQAANIRQGGVLHAPFGSLTLNSPDIVLASGSETSTSGRGQLIPFGETQGGFDWTYALVDDQTLVYGASGLRPPAQSINLNGTAIDFQAGATLDAAGGGDLLATEFVPGVGGTRDVLSATLRPDAFAIVPLQGLEFAPYDPRYYQGSSIRPGDSIYLAGGNGLPAGLYAVLPARYALLPGAYYVRAASGFQDIGTNERYTQLDGSLVVAGYRTFGGTSLIGSRFSGFAIRPGSEVLREATYTSARAAGFFAAQAQNAGLAATRLPNDAGIVRINAGSSLLLDGNLRGAPGTGGRGVAFDLTSDAIRITTDARATAVAGEVLVTADALSRLGAESVLLGGVRESTAEGIRIETRANRVSVDANARVTAPEVMLVARDQVSVASGAALTASGTLAQPSGQIAVSGDGSLLRVASAGNPVIQRGTGTGAPASLTVAAGATLTAPNGSVEIDSTGNAVVQGALQLAGGVLSLTGSRINLGNAPLGSGGVRLPSQQLAGLNLRELVLTGREGIDFFGDVSLATTNLTLQGGELRAVDSGRVALTATDRLTVTGLPGGVLPSVQGGTSTLDLNAGLLRLAAGTLAITGFGDARVTATQAILMSGRGTLATGANLSLNAPLLTAESGASHDYLTSGSFSFVSTGSATPTLATVPSLGARVSVTASSLLFDGRATLHSGLLSLNAQGPGGNVVMGQNARVDLSGVSTLFDSIDAASPGGSLSFASQSGSVRVSSGALIDVGTPGDGWSNAGSLSVSAPRGTVEMSGELRGRGANFQLDALSLPDFGALNSRLLTGGFTGDRSYRLRGPGDLIVGVPFSERIDARAVALTADQGNIRIDGSIASHGPASGSIALSASRDVTVTGTLDASPTAAGERNGRIELRSDQGGVRILASANVRTGTDTAQSSNDADGRLLIRAPQTGLASLLDGDQSNDNLVLAGDLSRVASVTVEGFRRYSETDSVIGATDVAANATNVRFSDATQFMSQVPIMTAALGPLRGPAVRFVPGIELVSSGNLTLSQDWLLNAWRFQDAAGVLTLRAAGDLIFNRSLNDGFSAATGPDAFVLQATAPSWSYRLAAGADLTSANPLAVLALPELGGVTGNLRIAPGIAGNVRNPPTARMIRTGTGSIEIATAGDLLLGNEFSMIYTAGVATDGVAFNGRGQLAGLAYPARGGDLRLQVGQDIVGARSNQIVTDWLWRVGRADGFPASATAWTVNFARFAQNLGTLGGGQLSINAARDIADLGIMQPSIGRQTGGLTTANNFIDIMGGGRMYVRAGRDVLGGMLYNGRGSIELVAGNRIGASPTLAGLYPVLALGDTRATLLSRGDATLAAVVNPTLLPQGNSQGAAVARQSSFFSTYGAASELLLRSSAGNLTLLNDVRSGGVLRNTLGSVVFGTLPDESVALRVYPPTLSAVALRGDVNVNDTLTLFPAPNGNLDLLAYGDVTFRSSANFELIQSDADPGRLPSVATPSSNLASVAGALNTTLASGDTRINAQVPVHLSGAQRDLVPSRVVALNGDVRIAADGPLSTLYFAEAARVIAGRDIRELGLTVQNLTASDVSAIVAGRDIVYTLSRGSSGQIDPKPLEINVDGPGTLNVRAGRNLELQTSAGISSRGNLRNPALAATGADISIQVGTGSHTPDYSAFVRTYLESRNDYNEPLFEYLRFRTGARPTSVSAALSTFRALSLIEQAPLIEAVLFAELRASGRSAAQAGAANGDFSRGFQALVTLYPGANPDTSKGESNPYNGNINLYFSRVYTLDGGNIRLLAPGGNINAGLATPPAAFGILKSPSSLGVVAQSTGNISAVQYGDFAVNESRVFAADGGDILVWSTRGDIDAGRGAKTAISAPPPTITFDQTGRAIVVFPAALTGSGIQTLATSPGRKPGSVDLFAPRGVVNAGDAGIVAGNLTIAATAVLGADNISVSGVAVGVPVDAGGLGASLASVGSAGSSASQAATQGVGDTGGPKEKPSAADEALGWLDVFVEGFGEEICKEKDVECLKRQKR